MTRPTEAQRRLLEAVRDGAVLRLRPGPDFCLDDKQIKWNTPASLYDRDWIDRAAGDPYNAPWHITESGLAALEGE